MEPHWFEDFAVGETFETRSRTVTDADIRAFAEVSGDRNPLHLDDDYAARSGFGGRVAHGVLGLAAVSGLVNESGMTRGTLIALAGIDWRFRRPMRPGDTVRARLRVEEARSTSRLDQGLVRLAITLVGEDGVVLQEGVWTILVRRRPA